MGATTDRSPSLDYRTLGGLRGILSRRAEDLYENLGEAGKRAAKQVFLRLVRPGRGAIDSRRRPPLSELTDLDVDPVALSEVLDAFGRHRLLSFDRDPVTGKATVEVAHEALLREWGRLAGWIDRHRAALRRHDTFSAAVEEWEAAGRDPDYLLAGSRLDEYETTFREGTLLLTGRERAFLDASLDRRRVEEAQEAAQSAANRRLERRARIRLVGLGPGRAGARGRRRLRRARRQRRQARPRRVPLLRGWGLRPSPASRSSGSTARCRTSGSRRARCPRQMAPRPTLRSGPFPGRGRAHRRRERGHGR